MKTAIKIGNTMHKNGVNAVADAIARIMGAGGDQKTIREALRAFSALSEVKNISISGLTIYGDGSSAKAPDSKAKHDANNNLFEDDDPMYEADH